VISAAASFLPHSRQLFAIKEGSPAELLDDPAVDLVTLAMASIAKLSNF
jgi:hypothetical protein